MEDTDSGEFNLHEAAEEIIDKESDSSLDSTEDSSQEAGQSGQDSQNANGEKELSPEEILNQVSKEQNDPNALKDVLEKINAMGAVHAGAPIKIDTPEKLKQLLEMGAGFYAKTEAHANEVKAKTEEFSKMEAQLKERDSQLATREQEIQNIVQENQIMEDLLLEMQQGDPELFNHLSSLYQQRATMIQRNAPMLKKYEGELNSLRSEIQGLKGQKQTEELGKIKEGWEKELSDVQSKIAAPLARLGVQGNWDKVKEVWAADASGKTTVEQAFYAVHGQDIAKAYASQAKLLQTRNKTASQLLNRNGVRGAQRGGQEEIEVAPGNYSSILRAAAAQL